MAAFSPQRLAARWRCSGPVGCRSTPGSSDGSVSTQHCKEVIRPECHARKSPASHPTQSSHAIPPSRLNTLDQVASITLYEPVNVLEGRLWPAASTPRIAEDREGYRMLVIDESAANHSECQGYFDGSLELLRELAV